MEDTPRNALIRIAVFAALMLILGRAWWFTLFCLFVVFRITQTEYFGKVRKTIRRDLRGLFLLIGVKREINRRLAKNEPIHKIFMERLHEHPRKPAIAEVETGRSFTYEELNCLMNQYANFFEAERYIKGDVISLFLENGIDFFALWLGLSKIGVVSAFINSNLKLEPLSHSIRVAKSKCVITSAALLPTLKKAINEGLLPSDTKVFLLDGDGSEFTSLRKELEEKSVSSAEPNDKGVKFTDVLCYIYTSGTTGNPKPAVIKHFRYFWIAMGSGRSFNLVQSDKVYITMPLYHTAAGVMGVGSVIVFGTTAIIRKKFSASNFWKDCVAYDCTASQYIGEICRYLLAQKPSAEEKRHRVRVMWGNGLRPEIWEQFVDRFGVRQIGELYGSTEGNSNIVNIDSHVGACGFMPFYPYLNDLYPVRLIKVDEETGALVRGKDGLCVPCRPGDTGEMIGVIKNSDTLLKFEGYVSQGDTQKKIYRDVVKKGDQVFASGDILYWDDLGYLYFKDRRGDTFRWKGENVSTTEVEGILQPVMDCIDATVYGVEVGKMEGRAGMAGIVLAEGVDQSKFLEEISQRLSANLAAYAIPVFIRFLKEVDKTGTFKLKKIDLQRQGFDLKKCGEDPVFYWNAAEKNYVALDAKMQEDIESGVYTRI